MPKTPLPTRTDHGFAWGAADVSCAAERKGHVLIHIETPKQRLAVRVTPTGLIRVGEVARNEGELSSVEI